MGIQLDYIPKLQRKVNPTKTTSTEFNLLASKHTTEHDKSKKVNSDFRQFIYSILNQHYLHFQNKGKKYMRQNTLGATVVAAFTTRPRNALLERAFCPRGAKDETLTLFDEALRPSKDTNPFAEIVDAVS